MTLPFGLELEIIAIWIVIGNHDIDIWIGIRNHDIAIL